MNPLKLSDRTTILPVIHGSAESALVVRKWMLEHNPDCLAVPLPPSFGPIVEQAITWLPTPSIVFQQPHPTWEEKEWSSEDESESQEEQPWSYVPIDPCQPVIMAIRTALGEHIPVRYIDRETAVYHAEEAVMPDPFALKKVSLERFATAVLPNIQRPSHPQTEQAIQMMAHRIKQLEKRFRRIVVLCSVSYWPWIREAYHEPVESLPEDETVYDPQVLGVDPNTLLFLFGELPFITALYEQARQELDDDEALSIDGMKQLLLAARTSYYEEFGNRSRKITPLLLSQCLKYMRNLSLMDRRLTPDLYTIATAVRGVVGDQYTIHVVETANRYDRETPLGLQQVQLGIDQARFPDQTQVPIVSRLPGPPVYWRKLELHRRPERWQSQEWLTRWNPMRQCSWPPEDEAIENFRSRVFDRARSIMGADLVRSEKFSTSFKDGIDIRETLRHWYDGDIYVKVMPPSVGTLDASIMLFDSPADPRDYPWRATWYAEHQEESTLAFYATHFASEILGPGVAAATYGGAIFLYPPRPIPDIWTDEDLQFCETLEERLVAAACLHAQARQVALASWLPPGMGWRRLAKRFGKSLVHVPLSHFSSEKVQQLRTFHVLNGQEVRSYAAHFIRKA